MSIYQLARNTQQNAIEKQERKNEDSQEETLGAVINKLNNVLKQVKIVNEAFATLKAAGLHKGFENIQRKAADIRVKLKESHDSFVSGDTDQQRVLESLYNELKQVAESLRKVWKEWVNENTKNHINFLKLVTTLQMPISDQADRIRKAIERCSEVSQLKQEDWQVLQEKVAEAKELYRKVNLPDDIQQFFFRVLDDAATLADITQDIWEWLEERDMLKRVTLKWRI